MLHKGEQVLSFRVYDTAGEPSTAPLLDFRGALNMSLVPVGDYLRSSTEIEVRWPGDEPIQIYVRWQEPGYGLAYLVLDNQGRGYAAGGKKNFNVELAANAWYCLERAYHESVSRPEVRYRPSRPLSRVRDRARHALERMGAAREDRTRAMAASAALGDTLKAWTMLLKAHGRAFARRHREQFVLGAMMTEPFADAWQYSVERMFTDYERRLELTKQQGLDTVGIVFLWRDDYTFSRPETFALYDQVVDSARRLGMNVMAMVLDSFDYLTHRSLTDEEFIEASRVQARNLATHFKGRIRFWTVTDETNGKNFLPHSFRARLEAGNEAARAIKSVDPSAVTMATLLFDDDLLPLLARLKVEKAIAPEVDVIALSLFQHIGPGADLVYRKIHELFPEKKVGVGETGYIVGKDCELIYAAPLNYPYGLGGGFWWFHWDGMIDRAIDGNWYTTRFYRELQDLAMAISGRAQTSAAEKPPPPTRAAAAAATAEPTREQSAYASAAWRAARWLREGGVFDANTGAVCEALDRETHQFAPPDLASAAQTLQLFLRAYGRSRDGAYLDAARQIAGFLAQHQVRGGIPFVSGALGEPGETRPVAALTNARAIEALLDFYFATGEERGLAVSEAAAGWLVIVMQNPDGSFKSAYDPATKTFVDGERDDWQHSRAFAHARVAAALFKVWEAVRETEPRYREGALRVLSWALALQNFNGSFKGHYNPVRAQASDDKFVPSLLEGVEGFFSVYAYLLRHPRDIALHPTYLEACRKFADWILHFAWSSEGAVWEWMFSDDSHGEPSALATAQALRLWLRLYLVLGNPEYLEAARRAGDFLMRAQERVAGSRAEGGFAAGTATDQATRISSRSTAVAAAALFELADVLAKPDLVLDPALPRYTGFDPFL